MCVCVCVFLVMYCFLLYYFVFYFVLFSAYGDFILYFRVFPRVDISCYIFCICCVLYFRVVYFVFFCVILFKLNSCNISFLLYFTYLYFLKFYLLCCIILTLPFFWSVPPESILTSFDVPVFILKLSECKQVELTACFPAALANLKYFYITWMVLAPFSDFSISSI